MLRDSHAARSDPVGMPDIIHQPLSHVRSHLAAKTPIGVEYLCEIVREQPQLIHRLAIEVSDPQVVRQMRAHGLRVLEEAPVQLTAEPPSRYRGRHFAMVCEGAGI